MKLVYSLTAVAVLAFLISGAPDAPAQTTPTQTTPTQAPAAVADIYHVHFTKAALGKAAQLGEALKKPADPKTPMPEHRLVLRHQSGDSWDYVVVQHIGAKATLDTQGSPTPAALRDLAEWHTDTFVAGPSWAQFAKAMGVGDQKTAGSIYIASVYRAATGHRDQLEALLGTPPSGGSAGSILMQHLEGGPWQYFTLQRYNSWQEYAASETKEAAEMTKGTGDWFRVRDHTAYHADTLTDRITP